MSQVFTMKSTRRTFSPWGAEVKKRLIDLRMKQNELVSYLRDSGFDIDKVVLSSLLYGVGVSSRQREIEAISRFLQIPYQAHI